MAAVHVNPKCVLCGLDNRRTPGTAALIQGYHGNWQLDLGVYEKVPICLRCLDREFKDFVDTLYAKAIANGMGKPETSYSIVSN